MAFKLNWKLFLGIHISVNIFSLVVLTPVFSLLMGWLILVSGQKALSDEDILYFALSPTGLLVMLLAAALYTTVVIFQQAAMIIAGHNVTSARRTDLAQLARYLLWKSWPLFLLAMQMIARTVLIAAPFLVVGVLIFKLFLTEFDINFYLANKPAVLWWAGGLILLDLLVMTGLLLRVFSGWILALPLLLLNNESPARVLNKSRQASVSLRFPITVTLLALFLIHAGMFGLLSMLADFAVDGIVVLAGNSLKVMAYLLGGLLVAWLLANLAIAFFGNSVLSLVVIFFYGKWTPGQARGDDSAVIPGLTKDDDATVIPDLSRGDNATVIPGLTKGDDAAVIPGLTQGDDATVIPGLTRGDNSTVIPGLTRNPLLFDRSPGRNRSLPMVILSGAALVVSLAAGLAINITMDRLNLDDHTMVVAHRGASAVAPENTLAAIEMAIKDGAEWVEIDVQETRDGEIVVIHDSDLKRVGRTGLTVSDASLAELQSVDIGSWKGPSYNDQRIPTLQQVLALCKNRIKVAIELKYYGRERNFETLVADIVDAADMQDQVIVMSLSYPGIQRMKSIRPDFMVGLLSSVTMGDITRLDADFFAVNASFTTRALVKHIHKRNRKVMVWTVNDPISISAMMSKGVDGIITDVPALAYRVRLERSQLETHERIMIQLASLVGKQPARPVQ